MQPMLRYTLFLTSLATLAIIHNLAITFYLYWLYLWIDIPIHMLGGAVVTFGVWLLPVFRVSIPERFMGLVPTLVVVFAVGILWELFEIGIGIPILEKEGYVLDTCIDLVMDLIGGYIGFAIIKYSERY